MASRRVHRLRRSISVICLTVAFLAYLISSPESYQMAGNDAQGQVKASDIALKDVSRPESLLAKDVLESLAVKDKNKDEKYYRKLFYDSWGTEDGCSKREIILKRDLKDPVMDGCKVMSGVLEDPYTAKTINFKRGQDTSSAVQIDHVVALSNAWSTGAHAMSSEVRYAMSQDPLNLIAVDGSANQEKSDQDASDWLPSNQGFHCQYVARQISVKYKYQLWVTQSEKAAMQNVLQSCPNEPSLGLENL